jgi:transcriptional regulator with GAF, ATPase, and Fis domain
MRPTPEAGPDLLGDARALLDAVVAISSDLDLHSVLDRIVVSACRMTGAQYGALRVLGTSGRLADFVTSGLTDEQHAAIGNLPRGKGILGLLVEEPRPLRLQPLQSHPASYGFPPGHPPMETFLGVPVRIRGTVFGNLYLTEKAGGVPFTDQDEQLAARARAGGRLRDRQRPLLRPERETTAVARGVGRDRRVATAAGPARRRSEPHRARCKVPCGSLTL